MKRQYRQNQNTVRSSTVPVFKYCIEKTITETAHPLQSHSNTTTSERATDSLSKHYLATTCCTALCVVERPKNIPASI